MARDMRSSRLRWLPATLALALLSACASAPDRQLASAVDLQQRADQAYAAGDMPAALAAYQQLAESMPDNADDWFRLANVYVRLQQPEQAVAAYQHVLQRNPSHAKAWYNLGIVRLRQAEAAFVQGARTAGGNDMLHKSSTSMVQGIAGLGPRKDRDTPAAAPTMSRGDTAAAAAVPATTRATSARAPASADSAGARP